MSLLTYWQRHPALSYLFSGRFIGTTSQAPRVDEGRSEALYELEIAFAEIARLTTAAGTDCCTTVGHRPGAAPPAHRHHRQHPPRRVLHRQALQPRQPPRPAGPAGAARLRDATALPDGDGAVAAGARAGGPVLGQPLRAPLIRHGLNLHGRYLLPHYIIHDIADVCADLRAHDINFDTSWLDPFTEFRFPRVGTAVFDHVEIELRGAIEPWNTLGEESTGTGTARYVDSSVERIQVRTIGADRQRHVLTCNGYPIPMLATDNPDIQVGGVRYRAWQPPSALHPTITVDGPLRFELVDTATGTSRGGCTYHVSHPGGRAYDSPPVNAVEAESRRGRRFEATGFTPGKVDVADIREKQARQSTDVGARGDPRPAPGAHRAAELMGTADPNVVGAGHSRKFAGVLQSGGGPLSLSAAGSGLSRPSHDPDRLLAGYRAARAQDTLFDLRGGAGTFGGTGYDEFVDATGTVRPSWQELG